MKLHLTLFLVMTASLLKAQDTVIVNNNFKFKTGIKFSHEGTADISDNTNIFWGVFGGGIQLIGKTNKSRSSLETGIYYTTKAKSYDYAFLSSYFPYSSLVVYNQYLCVPVNYRYDSKVIYISGGVFFDYLVHRFSRYSISDIYGYGVDRKFNLGFNVAVGIEKQISRSVNFFAEGKLFDTVSPVKQNKGEGLIENNFKTTYRNYGVAIGVNYKFFRKGN